MPVIRFHCPRVDLIERLLVTLENNGDDDKNISGNVGRADIKLIYDRVYPSKDERRDLIKRKGIWFEFVVCWKLLRDISGLSIRHKNHFHFDRWSIYTSISARVYTDTCRFRGRVFPFPKNSTVRIDRAPRHVYTFNDTLTFLLTRALQTSQE